MTLGDTTPLEILTKKKPNLANLYPWVAASTVSQGKKES